jgi:prophage regulatory protein
MAQTQTDPEARRSPVSRAGAPPDVALLRLPQVLALIPISKTTWWVGVREGRFPKPVRLGPRSVAWRSTDIATLIESFNE